MEGRKSKPVKWQADGAQIAIGVSWCRKYIFQTLGLWFLGQVIQKTMYSITSWLRCSYFSLSAHSFLQFTWTRMWQHKKFLLGYQLG